MFSSTKIPTTTILNVDDYPVSREAISLILKQEGFAAIEVGSGTEALQYVTEACPGPALPDLVLLDVKLPDITGYEVCRRLKQDSATAAIPVLMISGVWDKGEDKARGLDSGADGYLTKPVETAELIATIKALLRMRGVRPPLESEMLSHAILSSLPIHIAVLDRNGTIIAVNKEWERFNRENTQSGANNHNATVGVSYLAIYESAAGEQSECQRGALDGIQSVLRRERAEFTMEYPCHQIAHRPSHLADAWRWLQIHATQLPEEIGGAVVSHMNITARVLAEQEALAQAEVVSRMEDEFLATASHELRAPLNAILGWTKLLRGKTLAPEDAARALETIERSALAQSRILSDLLDVSRAMMGKLTLNVRPFNPIPVVEAAIDIVRPAADAKRVSIEPAFDALVGEITGDPDRLQQIIWNLVSNAVKFTPQSGKVTVRLRRSGPSLEELEIVVQDSGAGIKPEFLPYVFDPFRQADGSRTRRYGGLGLGLAIVRRLAELHGGTALAESKGENHGSTFTVRLPAVSSYEHAGNAIESLVTAKCSDPELEHSSRLAGMRILVVDDEPDCASLTGYLLSQWGAEVKTVISAAEALDIFERHEEWRPDILISDIQMPGIDGYALMRKVRKMDPERGGKIPAIALTAYTRAEDRIRALAAGFQIHVAKPFEPAELLTVVESIAKRIEDRG